MNLPQMKNGQRNIKVVLTVVIQKDLVNVTIVKGAKRNKCAVIVNEARLPIRCCPDGKTQKTIRSFFSISLYCNRTRYLLKNTLPQDSYAVTSGLPGCWANIYGSRAPECMFKVSNNSKILLLSTIKQCILVQLQHRRIECQHVCLAMSKKQS